MPTTTKKIAIFYTGGTIGMVKEKGVLVPSLNGRLQKWLEKYSFDNHIEIELISGYTPIDSSDANPALWNKLSEDIKKLDSKYNGVLILHGTDTMAYTASAISFLLPSIKIPIILTGSQLPISEPNSDAELNLSRSLFLLTSLSDRSLPNEVFIFFDGYLYRGNRSTKIDNESMHAFDSPNYPYCLRYDDNNTIEFNNEFKACERFPFLLTCNHLKPINIKVIFIFPGIENLDVDLDTCQAIILMTYGTGNAPTHQGFLKKIQEISKHRILILNLSQCLHKTSKLSDYKTGSTLRLRGVTDMRDMTLESCFTKLYCILNVGYPEQKKYLTRSFAGELTPMVPAFSKRYQNPDYAYFTPVKTCLVLQNSKYFGLESLNDILRACHITVFSLFVPEEYQKLKSPEFNSRQIDLVITLGANASVNQANQFPWILAEIEYIKNRIEYDLPLLGLGFGGQIIAKAMGAQIQKCDHGKEIGFYPLTLTEEGNHSVMKILSPEYSPVFEFHGETFSLPENAILLAKTEKYLQAFRIKSQCLAFQFHLEITARDFNALTSECFNYITDGGFDIPTLNAQGKQVFSGLMPYTVKFFTAIIKQFLFKNQAINATEESSQEPSKLGYHDEQEVGDAFQMPFEHDLSLISRVKTKNTDISFPFFTTTKKPLSPKNHSQIIERYAPSL